MPANAVSYVSDLEGQWQRFSGFVERDPQLSLDGDRLILADSAIFVFGGDAVDRGDSSRRLLRTFLDAKARYGERVVLLAGNRDLNKLRLARELTGRPPGARSAALMHDEVALLRYIFERTMGAPDAFAFRAKELEAEGDDSSARAVVASFLDDVSANGLMSRYLAQTSLAYRHGETLFVHGGLSASSFGVVPGLSKRIVDVDEFVFELNAFLKRGIEDFRQRRGNHEEQYPWQALIDYQAPVPGLHENPNSVVYGRLSDRENNPMLPVRAVKDALTHQGVHRLIVGHSPSGDLPAVVRSDDFEVIVADNSRGRVRSGSSVVVDGEHVHTRGSTLLDDGTVKEVHSRTTLGVGTPIGRRERGTHRLVKALLPDGRALTYRGLPGYVIEQLALAEENLEELVAPERDEPLLPEG